MHRTQKKRQKKFGSKNKEINLSLFLSPDRNKQTTAGQPGRSTEELTMHGGSLTAQ
jgi:hypothetical protein